MGIFKKKTKKETSDELTSLEEALLSEDFGLDSDDLAFEDLFASEVIDESLPTLDDVANAKKNGKDASGNELIENAIDEIADDGETAPVDIEIDEDLDVLAEIGLLFDELEGPASEVADSITESELDGTSDVETVLLDTDELTDVTDADTLEADADLSVDAIDSDLVSDEESDFDDTASIAPKTTDELIDEFIKSSMMGVEFAGELEDVGVTKSDMTSFGKTDSDDTAESVSPDDLTALEDVDESEFNTAEENPIGTTDMNLRIAFGLESEDEDSDEVKDAVKKLGDHLQADRTVGSKYKLEHTEFTDQMQARDIAGEYRVKRRSVSIRLTAAVVFTLLLAVFENITVITKLLMGTPHKFSGILDGAAYPVIYVMVSLQILFIVAALALPELKHGVVRLFSGAPTPESAAALVFVSATVCSIITAWTADGLSEPVCFNAVAAFILVMTLVYSKLNIKRGEMTFFVVGPKKEKYAMARIPDDEGLLESARYEDEDIYGEVMRIDRVKFVDKFFTRLGVPDRACTGFVAGTMGVAVAAAILFGIFAGRDGASASEISRIAYLSLAVLMPAVTALVFSYPAYRTSKIASENDSAIVGDASIDEYAQTAVVSLDDTYVFPSFGVKVQNIKIYNNARIDRVLYYASSAFKQAGGPLSDVFEVATMEMGRSEDVEIIDADRGYLAVKVDGLNIIFGSHSALESKGYQLPEAATFDDVDFSDELSIMYMLREDMLIAKMYIKYVLDGDVETMLSQFNEYGMFLCVKTYDPNIDEEKISSKVSMQEPPVKVSRHKLEDEDREVAERIDSGFVTLASPKTLLWLLPYCEKTHHTKRTGITTTIVSLVISLMMLALYNMTEGFDFIRSVHIIIWQFIWMIPAYLASRIFIR